VNISCVAEGVGGLSTYVWPPMYNRTLVRLTPGDVSSALEQLKSGWNEVNPDNPFIINFVDEAINNQYTDEQRWSKIINYASIFAIIIACMGLIGFIRLTIQIKLKEIGIRKVLGASITNILGLLSKRILGMVVVWWVGNEWLQTFPYHFEMNLWPFIIAVAVTLILAFISVGYQTVKAAIVNPTDILMDE